VLYAIKLNDSPQFVARLANDIVLGNLTGYQPGLDREVITKEQVMAAYNSAYRLAGRDLGHVPNNIVSVGVNSFSGGITRKLDDAVKAKNYPLAAGLTMVSMLNRSVLTTFLSGATNWIFLTAEKSLGLGLVTGGINTLLDRKERLQFGDDASIKDFTETLYNEGVRKSQLARSTVGVSASIIVSSMVIIALKATIGDDDDDMKEVLEKYAKWRADNPSISKLTDKLAPELLTAVVSWINGTMNKYAERKWSLGADMYSPPVKMGKAIQYLAQDKDAEAGGQIGEMVGQVVNAPLPWRMIRDVVDLSQGFKGEYKKPNYTQSRSFVDGVLRGGFLNWVSEEKVAPPKLETFSYYGKKIPLTKELSDKLEKYKKEAIDAKIAELKNLDEYKNADKELKKELEKQVKDDAVSDAEYKFIDENEDYLEAEDKKIPEKDTKTKDAILKKLEK